MASPMVSHIKKRSQVMTVSPVISPAHNTMEIKGNQGTSGTRNPRRRSGCVRRRMITPSETSTKAKSVPILERSAASLIAKIPAGMPTAKPAIQVDQHQVAGDLVQETRFGDRGNFDDEQGRLDVIRQVNFEETVGQLARLDYLGLQRPPRSETAQTT